jgi:hypothetical protein
MCCERLRNSIEHQFAKAPTKKRCQELLDFVWYFLRSTDNLLLSPMSGYYIEQVLDDIYLSISVSLGPDDNWSDIFIGGHFPCCIFSLSAEPNWLHLQVIQAGEAIATDNLGKYINENYNANKPVWIHYASIVDSPETINKLIKSYFIVCPFSGKQPPSEEESAYVDQEEYRQYLKSKKK